MYAGILAFVSSILALSPFKFQLPGPWVLNASDLDLFGENSYGIHLASVFNMFEPEIATIINSYLINSTY